MRTLLLNVDGSTSGFTGATGEEFIPPTFRALSLPTYLLNIQRVLFGVSPDRLALNYAVRQYLGLLHKTELAEFVFSLDPRVTYDLLPTDDLFDSAFATTVRKLNAVPSELFLVDEVGPIDQGGRTTHSWRIAVTSGSQATVTRQTPPAQVSLQEYTLTESLSSLVQLVGSGLQARFQNGVGAEWLVTATARPTRELGVVTENIGSLDGSDLDSLFGVGSPKAATEPFKTFKNLWKDHPELPYRLGAILLAWVYQADEIWQGATT